jgi:hypothetical protein
MSDNYVTNCGTTSTAKFNDLVALLSDKQLNTEMRISPDLEVLIDGFKTCSYRRLGLMGRHVRTRPVASACNC